MASSTGTSSDVAAAAHALGKLQGTPLSGTAGRPLTIENEEDDDSAVRVLLPDAYCFQGKLEFYQLESDTNKSRKDSLLKMFRNTITVGVCEIKLIHFHKWYKDLRFADAIDRPHENDGSMVWEYGLIMFDTSASKLHHATNATNLKIVTKFMKIADSFYRSGFVANTTTKKCIALALKTETTIMIVARRMKSSTKFSNFRLAAPGSMIVVAAITFRAVPEEKNPLKIAVSVSWLNVVNDGIHPTKLVGWQRQGFGLFMIICMLKYINCNERYKQPIGGTPKAPEVSVYLQTYEASAFQFYVMLGFKQLNKRFQDGFELLPIELQRAIERSAEDATKAPGSSTFHFYRRVESEMETETPAYQLLYLPYQALQHFREPTAQKKRSVVRPIYCQYPPPKIRGIRLQYNRTMLAQVFAKVPLIDLLLPELKAPVPASDFFEKGFMLVDRRIEHTIDKGKCWMSSSEIDLLNSLLMIDGRYADDAFILPSGYADAISDAYNMIVNYRKATRLRQALGNKPMSDEEIAKAIADTCTPTSYTGTGPMSYSALCDMSSKALNHLLEKVVHRHPDILKRKMLVFPKCINNHWSLVFVFNASYIEEQLDSETRDCGLRPCFFRYCSIFPDGTRSVPVEYGIQYFLNLCYSFAKHESKPNKAPGDKMQMFEPFGPIERSVGSFFLGTKAFPALRIQSGASDVLPTQVDGHNCGIGICAALGIILRDLADNEMFEDTFATKSLTFEADEGQETYCLFPPILTPLPDPTKLPFGDYLTSMREQWFLVFDRLATLQHETIPKSLFSDFVVFEEYAQHRDTILKWPLDGKSTSAKQNPVAKKQAGDANKPKTDEKKDADPDKSGKKDDTRSDANKPKTDEKKDADPDKSGKKDDKPKTDVPKFTKIDMKEVDLRLPISKRKLDWIEDTAHDLYKKIKEKDPEDAKALEPIPPKWRKPVPKVCTQSAAETDAYYSRFGTEFTAPERIEDDKFTRELEEYVNRSFQDWEWHSNEEHEAWIKAEQAKADEPTRSRKSKKLIVFIIKAVKAERQKYKAVLAREFKFTRSTLVQGLKYIKKNNSFSARLVWKAPPILAEDEEADPHAEDVEYEEDMRVEEEWIKQEYGQEMVQHLINMRQTQQWNEVPRDVAVRIGNKKIVRVRYMKPRSVFVLDVSKMQEEQEAADADDAAKKMKALKRKSKLTSKKNDIGPSNMRPDKLRPSVIQSETQASPAAHKTPPPTPRKSKGAPPVVRASIVLEENQNDAFTLPNDTGLEDDTTESPVLKKPKVEVKVGEKWLGKTENGEETILDEQFVRMAFGEAFTNELKRTNRGFVDIPVGDSKPSHLYQHPELKIIGAPIVRFPQSEGKDLCVSKSLASALFAIGETWHDAALKIDAFGENVLQGTAVDALDRVKTEIAKYLPRWFKPRQLPKNFDWHSDLQEHDLLVGVLHASDGSCSHAVTIYGREFVYDANEAVALPLCDGALDYCTSTEKVKSTFVRFKRGFFCRYDGKKPSKIAKVTHDIM